MKDHARELAAAAENESNQLTLTPGYLAVTHHTLTLTRFMLRRWKLCDFDEDKSEATINQCPYATISTI